MIGIFCGDFGFFGVGGFFGVVEGFFGFFGVGGGGIFIGVVIVGIF